MKVMKTMVSTLCAATLLMGALAGCGGKTGGESGKTTELKLWLPPFASDDSGALDKQFWEKTLKPWTEKEKVKLNIEITPWGNYEEKYLTGFSSGQGPDVGYMYLEMYNDFIDMGALADLDKYITKEDRDNYLYLDKGFIKGHQYAIPFVVGNARLLFFNMDIMKKAGVTELPKTWDDLVQVLEKVKNANLPGIMPFAGEWAGPSIGALNNLYYPYLWQAGGELYNKEGTKVTLMDNNAAVEAAQFIHDLKFKYKVLPDETMSMQDTELRSQFAAGHIACASMQASVAKTLDENKINWDFVPSLKKEKKAIWISADSLIMNAKSKDPAKAMDLIRDITSAANMEKFHTELASFPPIRKDEKYVDNPRFKSVYADSKDLHTLYVAKGSSKVMDKLFKNLQLMMLGDLKPEEAIQQTVDFANTIK